MPGAHRHAVSSPEKRSSSVPPSGPSAFGRIDDDGTAWVHTATGERRIGEWHAGTPAEGLQHYGRRFDALQAEVQLLNSRLETHPAEAARLRRDAHELQQDLSVVAAIGDLDSLDRQLHDFIERAALTAAAEVERNELRKSAALARKQELIAETENLGVSGSPNWKDAGTRIHAIVDEWKSLPRTDNISDDALWERFRAARNSFHDRRTAHFADLDRSRDHVRRVKEALVDRAESLKSSTDWAETARSYRDLMTEWKSAGRAHREDDDRLWSRFRAAQDYFFDARSADTNRREAEFEANARAKQALLTEYAHRITPANGLDRARDLLRELEEKWDAIGYVPRNQIAEFDSKLGALESRVTDFAEAQWRATDPEALARVDQFRTKVSDLTLAAENADKAGKSAKAAELREQAAQWSQWAEAAASAVNS